MDHVVGGSVTGWLKKKTSGILIYAAGIVLKLRQIDSPGSGDELRKKNHPKIFIFCVQKNNLSTKKT